jgi:hypothetical protein
VIDMQDPLIRRALNNRRLRLATICVILVLAAWNLYDLFGMVQR